MRARDAAEAMRLLQGSASIALTSDISLLAVLAARECGACAVGAKIMDEAMKHLDLPREVYEGMCDTCPLLTLADLISSSADAAAAEAWDASEPFDPNHVPDVSSRVAGADDSVTSGAASSKPLTKQGSSLTVEVELDNVDAARVLRERYSDVRSEFSSLDSVKTSSDLSAAGRSLSGFSEMGVDPDSPRVPKKKKNRLLSMLGGSSR